MRGLRGIIYAGIVVAACVGADPVDARSTVCGAAAVPPALTQGYAVLRAPARRADALPRGADCRVGDLRVFGAGARLLARHADGSRTYFLPVYERRTATGYEGLAVCVATLTRYRRVYLDVGGCFSDARASGTWFNPGARTLAAVPDGVARVRLQISGESAEREVAVRRNAVVLDGAAPLSFTWLAADGSVVPFERAPFVCEE